MLSITLSILVVKVLGEGRIVFKDRRTCPLLGKHGFVYAPMTE